MHVILGAGTASRQCIFSIVCLSVGLAQRIGRQRALVLLGMPCSIWFPALMGAEAR